MTNLAIEKAMMLLNIPFERSNVGDRYVLELLNKNGWQLGGESSGHIVCLDKHTTGDGIISALQVLYALRDSKLNLREATGDIKLFPQRLINVRVAKGLNYLSNPSIQAIVQQAENDLNSEGRVLLRASGTEPLIRVMVEGSNQQKVNSWAEKIANSVQEIAQQQESKQS